MSASPLHGLLVVDLTRHLPGPLATHLLADLGARVLKVEEPTRGDPVREAPPSVKGQGALATLLLSGVESLALDLKQEAPRAILLRLLEDADVLVESFRPGTMKRLGLDPAVLHERFPRLVICSISGWGQDGPRAARAGHDLTYQAAAGSLAPTGTMPALPVADMLGAWAAVSAMLAALYERRSTGQGAHVDAALQEAAVHGNLTAWAAEVGARKQVGERLPLTGSFPCYNLYHSQDGHLLALAALEPKFWQRLCEAVERRDLIPLQYRQDEKSRGLVAALIESRSAAQWERLAEELDLPMERVRTAAEVLSEVAGSDCGLLRIGADGLPRLGFPTLIDGLRPAADERCPGLGEDTWDVLEEWRLDAAGLSERRRRAAGIGRRKSLRRTLWRLISG